MELASPPSAPDAATRDTLLDALAAFIAKGGAGPLLAPPIAPSAGSFPEPWRPTRAGVETLLRRLMWHAGIDRAVTIVDQRRGAPPTERKPETNVTATAVGTREARFVLDFVGTDDVVGTLAHEIGVIHAVLARGDEPVPFRTPELPTGDAYRDSAEALHEVDHDRDLERGSVAAVYLGLGVVAANASFQQYSQGGRFNGAYVPLEYDVLCAGYLPLSSIGFLLAVQAIVRRDDGLPPGLHNPQRDEVGAWLDALRGRGDELRARLGIDDAAVAAPRPDVEPFPDVELDDDDEPAPKTAFRWRSHRGFVGLAAGAFLGGGIALALPRGDVRPLVAVASMIAGHVAGRRVRVPRCSECATVVEPTDEACVHCGAELRGDIAHRADRLEAEERLDRDV